MIKIYKYENLGTADFGWLKAHYHFSFSRYYSPKRLGFGALKVINDDIVAQHSGFETHGHNNMEIITYVKKGAISHKDSLGNEGKTRAGDVQVMSAGKGILHSEHNHEDEQTELYQIWITPNKENVKPRWESASFPKNPIENKAPLPLLVCGFEDERAALKIYQDAAIYGGNIKSGNYSINKIKHQAYVLASSGEFFINDISMQKGDGAEISDEKEIIIKAKTDCEVLIIDVID